MFAESAPLASIVTYDFPVRDALILPAARASGASELITEDLSRCQNYGGFRAVNPFL